jgi:hypothetical protein
MLTSTMQISKNNQTPNFNHHLHPQRERFDEQEVRTEKPPNFRVFSQNPNSVSNDPTHLHLFPFSTPSEESRTRKKSL